MTTATMTLDASQIPYHRHRMMLCLLHRYDTCAEAKRAGHSCAVAKAWGYSPKEVKEAYSLSCADAKAAGYSLKEMTAAGYVEGLKAAGYSCEEAKAAGYSCGEAKAAGYVEGLKAAGYSCEEAKAAGYTPQQCCAAGFSLEEGKAAGYHTYSDQYNQERWQHGTVSGNAWEPATRWKR